MTTASTQGLIALFMARVLDFTPMTGDMLRTRLGGGSSPRLYVEQAPDVVTYPYAVLSWKSAHATEGDAGLQIKGEMEIQVYDRPRGNEWRAQGIADVMQQAMLTWGSAVSGATWAGHVRRQRVPLAAEPADRELVRIIVFVPVTCWPVMLSQYVL